MDRVKGQTVGLVPVVFDVDFVAGFSLRLAQQADANVALVNCLIVVI